MDPALHVERGWVALEEGRPEAAVREARLALAADPRCVEAHCLLGREALQSGDRFVEADGHFRSALDLALAAPATAEVATEPLLGLADVALERDPADPAAAEAFLTRALAVIPDDEELFPLRLDTLLTLIEAIWLQGDEARAEAALVAFRYAPHQLTPEMSLDFAGAWLAVGQLAKAEEILKSAIAGSQARPVTQADAHHMLAVVYEQRDAKAEMIEQFLKVHTLDLTLPRAPFSLGTDAFEALAVSALEELPELFREKLKNVPVVVSEYPAIELVREGSDPRMLGCFNGVPYPEHGAQVSPHLESIFLYQRNIERDCESVEEVADEVRTTVLHETGHFFGFSEDDLDAIGLG